MRMGNHKVLRTPDANLWRYSMYDLIEAVHKNALIWDREHSDFHNRELRQEAWHEVARLVYENFDDALDKDKDEIIKTLQKRWKNTRDSFLRNWRLKWNSTDSSKGAYIYDKEMAFLLKCKEEQAASANEADNEQTLIAPAAVAAPKRVKKVPNKRRQQPKRKAPGAAVEAKLAGDRDKKRFKRERRSSSSSQSAIAPAPIEEPANADGIAGQLDDDSAWETEATSFDTPTKKRQQQTKAAADIPNSSNGVMTEAVANAPVTTTPPQLPLTTAVPANQVVGSEATAASSTMPLLVNGGVVEQDADQAFFDSIKPHLLKMTSDQKLDFQIDVLKLLRNYRN